MTPVSRYGVFQDYFIRNKTFGDASEAALGAVGTIYIAIEYASLLLLIPVAQQWRHKIPSIMWSCLCVCCISLVCASFVTQLNKPQSGGFSSAWPAVSVDIVGPEHQAAVPSVFGVLGIPKGIAAVIGPIIAAALHHPRESAI
ncbi:unnamed protein product [Rhizoctonia solani]|uniref:Uncharacterized protein n=1 Tax=Rhizoctonia solani TaxID=456999 RepID=A0A8H3DXD3_9AGAM|nr:unnamed protein product [Rhizoctonia solani]